MIGFDAAGAVQEDQSENRHFYAVKIGPESDVQSDWMLAGSLRYNQNVLGFAPILA